MKGNTKRTSGNSFSQSGAQNKDLGTASQTLEDVYSINNEYEYENGFKPYSYSKSFSQLSILVMTPSSSL